MVRRRHLVRAALAAAPGNRLLDVGFGQGSASPNPESRERRSEQMSEWEFDDDVAARLGVLSSSVLEEERR